MDASQSAHSNTKNELDELIDILTHEDDVPTVTSSARSISVVGNIMYLTDFSDSKIHCIDITTMCDVGEITVNNEEE